MFSCLVVTATCDIEEVRAFRCEPSRSHQGKHQLRVAQTIVDPLIAIHAMRYTRVDVEFSLSSPGSWLEHNLSPSQPREPFFHVPEEEIALGPACWLW